MTKTSERLQNIVSYIEARGFASVKELSQHYQVSEMTIRRDLNKLAGDDRITRTFGGGASVPSKLNLQSSGPLPIQNPDHSVPLFRESDVLITTLFNPKYDPLIFDSDGKPKYPIVSEAVPHTSSLTRVGIDDYAAGFDLGSWAGEYSLQHFGGIANILDLTYHLPNTEERSRGFINGVSDTLPDIGFITSLNPQSRFDLAYQLTRDALEVYDNINIVFAINDTNAWGAIQACVDLQIDPEGIIVVSFGLEGDTIKNAINNGLYCKASIAMFPEIVGQSCINAAILAFRSGDLPERVVTPYALLTKENLADFYTRTKIGWVLKREYVQKVLKLPEIQGQAQSTPNTHYPNCIGVLIPFPEHEWYQNMVDAIVEYASGFNIEIKVLDAEQSLKDELEFRKREIARRAAQEIKPGDTVFVDGGIVTQYLVEFINKKTNITVITNSTDIFDNMENYPEITLISTGGVFRRNSRSLVGPTAENLLRDMRVDKLFLTVSGVSIDFGLSHSSVSEVTIKQSMIKSSREVILLADHTKFNQESLTQIAPINVVDLLITDNGLPASSRLQLNKAGIDVIIAHT